MADDTATDWNPGQPPPWLDAFGPPAQSVAPENPLDASTATNKLTPEEEARIEIDQPSAPPLPAEAPAQPLSPADWSAAGLAPTVTPEQANASAPYENQIAQSAAAGVEWKPSEDRLADLQGGTVAPAERQKTIDQLTPDDQAKAVATMTPDEYTTWRARRDATAILEDARQRHEIEQESVRRAAEDLAMKQAATAKADADMKQVAVDALRISNTHTNPNRYRENEGVIGTIARYLALAVGGAMSQYTGGRNLALEQFNKNVENDIASQRDDIANQWKGVETRKGAIAAEYERHGDMYKAQETFRLAATQSAIAGLQAEEQQYDPAGTTAGRVRDSLTQLHAQQQQQAMAVHAYLQKQNLEKLKAGLDAMKVDQESQKIAEEARKNKASEQLARQKEYREANAAENKKGQTFEPAELQALHPGMPVPPIKMTLGDYKAWLEAGKIGEESIKASRENKMGEGGTQIRNPITGAALTDTGAPDGAPIVKGTVDQAKETNEGIVKAQNLVDSLSKARRFLASDPSAFSRAEWAALGTELENAKVSYIETHKAKPSSREMEAVQGIFGPDFEHFRDRVTEKGKSIARLDAIIAMAKRETATDLRTGSGYKGPSVLLDTSQPPSSAPTSVDAAVEALAHDPTKAKTDSLSPDDLEYLKFLDVQPKHTFGIGVKDYAGENPAVRRADDVGILPSKLKAFDALAQMAADPAQRDAALAAIDEQAKNGNAKAIRKYAREMLQKISDETLSEMPATEPSPQD